MKRIAIFTIILILFSLYIWRHTLQESTKWDNILANQPSKYTKIEGRLTREPYQKYSKDIIFLDGVYISTDQFSLLQIGDKLSISGNLEKRVTDKKYQQFWLMEPKIKVISRANNEPLYSPFNLLYRLHAFSTHLVNIAKYALSEPHSSLLAGILLGKNLNMPRDFYNKLVKSGTLHVIAASGFNITIVAKILIDSLTKIISRRKSLVIAFIGIVTYTMLAGASEAVVRAAIMGSLAYTAQALGRDYTAKWALVISAAAMLLVKPTIVISVSFQLSITATAGILWLEPILSKFWTKFWDTKNSIITTIKTDLSTTIAATIAVLPITLITFNQFSIVSPLANVMVLWLVPPIMFLGAILVSAGLVSSFIAKIVGIIVWPFLELFINIVSWWGSLPFASLEIPGLTWLFAAGYYLILISLISLSKSLCKNRSSR